MTAANERGEDTSWIAAPLCASLYLCKANSIRVPLRARFCCGGSGILVARVHLGTSLTRTTHTHASPALHSEVSTVLCKWSRFLKAAACKHIPSSDGNLYQIESRYVSVFYLANTKFHSLTKSQSGLLRSLLRNEGWQDVKGTGNAFFLQIWPGLAPHLLFSW